MARKAATKKDVKKMAKRGPRKADARLTTAVDVEVGNVKGLDKFRGQMDAIEKAASDAVVRGVESGVNEVMRRFAGGLVPANEAPPSGRRSKKASASVAGESSPVSAEAQQPAKQRRKASPRQRGSLEVDAKKVFGWLSEHPNSRNEDIVKGTGLDAKTVGAAVRFLRGYNVRKEVVRDPIIELPNGDQRRYTIYRVIEGATFPSSKATTNEVELPGDLLPEQEESAPASTPEPQPEDADEAPPNSEEGGADRVVEREEEEE